MNYFRNNKPLCFPGSRDLQQIHRLRAREAALFDEGSPVQGRALPPLQVHAGEYERRAPLPDHLPALPGRPQRHRRGRGHPRGGVVLSTQGKFRVYCGLISETKVIVISLLKWHKHIYSVAYFPDVSTFITSTVTLCPAPGLLKRSPWSG